MKRAINKQHFFTFTIQSRVNSHVLLTPFPILNYLFPPGDRCVLLFLQLFEGLQLCGCLLHLVDTTSIASTHHLNSRDWSVSWQIKTLVTFCTCSQSSPCCFRSPRALDWNPPRRIFSFFSSLAALRASAVMWPRFTWDGSKGAAAF